MTLRTALQSTILLPLLAACGSGGTGPELLTNYIANSSGNAALEEQIMSSGVTGYVGNTDGTVSKLAIRVDNANPQNPVAYVSRDGGSEVAYTVVGIPSGNSVDLQSAGGDIVNVTFSDTRDYHGLVFGDAFPDSIGSFGIQTPAGGLPGGNVQYTFLVELDGEAGAASASMQTLGLINVDFAGGAVSGTAGGPFSSSDGVSDFNGNISASIAGSVTGGEIDATMTVTGDASGSFDMLGAAYGDLGGDIAGGVGGSLTSGAGTIPMGGTFRGSVPVIGGPT